MVKKMKEKDNLIEQEFNPLVDIMIFPEKEKIPSPEVDVSLISKRIIEDGNYLDHLPNIDISLKRVPKSSIL